MPGREYWANFPDHLLSRMAGGRAGEGEGGIPGRSEDLDTTECWCSGWSTLQGNKAISIKCFIYLIAQPTYFFKSLKWNFKFNSCSVIHFVFIFKWLWHLVELSFHDSNVLEHLPAREKNSCAKWCNYGEDIII